MHELSLVEELLVECERRSQGRAVSLVRVRRPLTLDQEELRMAFDLLVADTSVAGAELEVESVPARLECSCGVAVAVGPDDVAGHLVICPSCGSPKELESAPLELLEVRLAEASGSE